MSRLFLIVSLILALGTTPALHAQVVTRGPDSVLVPTDTTSSAPKPQGLTRPAKAALWALIPGGGQLYNRDYWKVPIVYVVLGGMTYLVVHNHTRFQEFRRGYLARTDNDTLTVDTGPNSSRYIRDESVGRVRDFYRRNRDLCIIFGGVAYGLSIMEALVDAHLATFSISDDLSLQVSPTLLPLAASGSAPGIGFTLTLRRSAAAFR